MVSVLVVVAIEMFFASRGAGHVHGSEYDTYGVSTSQTKPSGYLGGYKDDDDGSGAERGGRSRQRPNLSGQAQRSTTRARLLQSPLVDEFSGPKKKGHRPQRIDIDDADASETVGLVAGVSPAIVSPAATTPRRSLPRQETPDEDENEELELDEFQAGRNAGAYSHRKNSDASAALLDDQASGDTKFSRPERPFTPESSDESHSSPHRLNDAQENQRLLLQCLLLEAGILFHSVFIGIALSVSTGPPFVILLLAISFHQTFEGLALGARISALTFEPRSPKPWLMALAYGTTTPIGQAIGLAVHNLYDPESQTGLLMVGTMNAVSSGLLLFAGLVELLAEDFLSEQSYTSLQG